MILVTGSTGIVGIHLMIELLRRGAKVRALCRPSSDKNVVKEIFDYYKVNNLYKEIEWFEADILDIISLTKACEDVETIYHTAAMVSFIKREHRQMWQTNVEGTANLIKIALEKNIQAFCHVSSIGAIGHSFDGKPSNEDTAWQSDDNRSIYSRSKFRQEMEIWRGIRAGLNAVIVNPGVILGPGKMGRSSCLIAQTMKKGTRYYTEGATGYIDVRDLVKVMIDLTEKEKFGERYIVVSENCSVQNLQNMFAEEFGKPKPTHKAGKRLLHLAAFFLSIFNRRPALTHESVRAMGGNNSYSSQKLIETIEVKFRPINESVKNMTNYIKLAHKS